MGKSQRGRQTGSSATTRQTTQPGKQERSASKFRALTSRGSSSERSGNNSSPPPSRRQTRQEKKKNNAASSASTYSDEQIVEDTYKVSFPLNEKNSKASSTSKEEPSASAAKETPKSREQARNTDQQKHKGKDKQ